MIKRIFSIIFIVFFTVVFLVGCEEETVKFDREVIIKDAVKISALIPSDNNISTQIIDGITFANSLADSVRLTDTVSVNVEILEYTDINDVNLKAQSLVDNGSSLIIYAGDDYNSFFTFTNFVSTTEIPVISLSPYTYESDNFFSLTLSPDYLATCVATYVNENNYKNPLIVTESSNDYYQNLLNTFKNTFLNLSGYELATIINGESDNDDYSSYDFVFLATSKEKREEITDKIRSLGFIGEIMFDEVLDKTPLSNNLYNDCSLISKIEEDNSNNVATVFRSMYLTENNVSADSISAATAYGYDAYMLAFEGLKNLEITETPMLSDFSDIIRNTKYIGVTDYITFENSKAIPTYIYVDKIIDEKVVFNNKYTFNSNKI